MAKLTKTPLCPSIEHLPWGYLDSYLLDLYSFAQDRKKMDDPGFTEHFETFKRNMLEQLRTK